jgi:hypothetical protein
MSQDLYQKIKSGTLKEYWINDLMENKFRGIKNDSDANNFKLC